MLSPGSDPGPVLSQPVPCPGMRCRQCYWGAAEVQHELLFAQTFGAESSKG